MDFSAAECVVSCLVVLLAAFVHATTGIGFAMMAMSLMALYMTGVESAAVVCYCCLLLVIYMTYKLRRSINYRIMWPPMLGLLVGKVAGVALLMHIDGSFLRPFLGLTFMLIAIYFFFQNKLRIKPGIWKGLLIGTVAGIMGGLYNLSGAVVAVYFFSACEDINEYSGSMNMAFIPSEIGGCAVHLAYGNISVSMIGMLALCVAAIIIGIYVGIKVFQKMNRRMIARLLYGYMAVMGVVIALT